MYHALKAVIKKKYGMDACNVGDEGGFAPNIQVPYIHVHIPYVLFDIPYIGVHIPYSGFAPNIQVHSLAVFHTQAVCITTVQPDNPSTVNVYID